MKRWVMMLVILLASELFVSATATASDLRTFGPEGMRIIEKENAGVRFIVALWSTDCPPCRRELAMLGAFAVTYPDVPIVLLATDPPDNAKAVVQVLASLQPPGADVWQFGDAGAERLRHAIDPGWRGEMPRSYLYSQDGERVGISGPISQDLLEHWLEGSSSERSQ